MPEPAQHPATDVQVAPVEVAELPHAAQVLTEAERAAGGELVDEAERRRLTTAAQDPGRADPRWRPLLAHLGGEVVGYAALVVDADARAAVGDVAPAPSAPDGPAVLAALLAALADHAVPASRVQVWARRVGADHLAAAGGVGYAVHRRLGVLGRELPVEGPAPDAPVPIRASRPGDDDAEIVRVLAAAYEGTDDGGWDLDRFHERTGWDWFRAEDLLVADAGDGRLLGLHWTKRRDAATGEVHNLAVAPEGQGRGLGPALLRAGLDHLGDVGCTEVVLWVDRANARAVQLYERAGFTTRWDDVALTTTRP